MNNHILFGYQLDGKGGGKSLLNNRGYEETKSNSGIVCSFRCKSQWY